MSDAGLHVTYRRSGGIAGLDLVAECAGSDLPQDHARVARDLLDAPADEPGRGGTEREAAVVPAGADRFTYTVHITDGTRHRTLTWSEGAVPSAAEPLLASLGGLATPQRAP
ncbi:protealysin inhibitor emfourin [Terrabacter aerolatus]|nr:protealysin inhibitor emfourin [Terrabacter aerolatus]